MKFYSRKKMLYSSITHTHTQVFPKKEEVKNKDLKKLFLDF